MSNFTNGRDCAKKTGVVRRSWPTPHLVSGWSLSVLKGRNVYTHDRRGVYRVPCNLETEKQVATWLHWVHAWACSGKCSQDRYVGGQTTAGARGEEAWLQVSNTYDETRKQQTYKHKHEDNWGYEYREGRRGQRHREMRETTVFLVRASQMTRRRRTMPSQSRATA